MRRLRAVGFDDNVVSCSHLSTPRSQSYLGAVARAKDRGAARSIRESESTSGVIVLAFDANAKEASAHSTILWALEHALKRSDTLAIVATVGSLRGPLGYRAKVGDQKWQSANRIALDHELHNQHTLWTTFPGLQTRCNDGGVRLTVTVKPAHHPEVTIAQHATALNATLLILDKSLKKNHQKYYLQHLTCAVTRMRQSGGVEVVRSQENYCHVSFQPRRASTSRLSSARSTASSTLSRRSCSSYIAGDEDEDLFTIFGGEESEEETPCVLTQVPVSRLTFVVGLGECVEIHLRGALRRGEGVLVGGSPSALFLLRPQEEGARAMSAGAPACYVAMEGGMAVRLAHVECDQRVLVVDADGGARSVAVGHAVSQLQPLVLVEAGEGHSVMLHHSATLCLGSGTEAISMKDIKPGDGTLMRLRSLQTC